MWKLFDQKLVDSLNSMCVEMRQVTVTWLMSLKSIYFSSVNYEVKALFATFGGKTLNTERQSTLKANFTNRHCKTLAKLPLCFSFFRITDGSGRDAASVQL